MTKGSSPFSKMTGSLIGSEVLKIAGDISALVASGKKIINFTVGDFDPQYFPIPAILKRGIFEAYEKNQTNYPPSSGLASLREAIAEFYTQEFAVPTQASEVLVAGGARPLIYAVFTAFVDEGDTVLYPVPSWNNNHYAHLTRARGIAIKGTPENGFMPRASEFVPHIEKARLLCLNSPLNPTGTVMSEHDLREICELVVKENARRASTSERPLFLMYDQIYWKLVHGEAQHFHPVKLVPAVKPFTITIDGVSKYFCGTGIRVGWSVLPENLVGPFSNLLGHVGAWAPKPEQVATAQFLKNRGAIDDFIRFTGNEVSKRLDPLFEGIEKLQKAGLPISAVKPQGGIYLSMRIAPNPRMPTNESLRKALLEKAGIAVVPFQAFGLQDDSGWFRMSVGAVSLSDVSAALGQIENFLRQNH